MGIFDKIFGNKEKIKYKMTLAQVSNPLMDRIDELPEKEVREFFKVILDAAERSLRGILFIAPEEFNFKKVVTQKEIDFWLRKVSLALVAYSYYFFSVEEQSPIGQASFKMYWQRMFGSYNKIFDGNITIDDINHYAAGLKEDIEKKYSASGEIHKKMELTIKDYATIATELLENIWHENITTKVKSEIKVYGPIFGVDKLSQTAKKIIFLGTRIWKAHQQIVQPFLPKLLTM